MVTEGGGGGGVGGERAHLNTDPCGTQLRLVVVGRGRGGGGGERGERGCGDGGVWEVVRFCV